MCENAKKPTTSESLFKFDSKMSVQVAIVALFIKDPTLVQ